MAQLSNLIVNGVTRLLSKLYVSDSVTAPNFIGKLTGTAAKLGRNGDADTPMTFNWSGKDGQPTWLWGGENGSDMYVYNPSNFSVKNAKAAGSADSATKLSSSAGSATQPVYFSDGKPVATTYTLGKSVPASAVFTDTNTWRGVQNNLTSDATDQSLSAAQGKVLKGLVDGKAPSGHTHDDRYYTESEINTKLAGKADSGHIHLQGTESGKVDWNTLKTFGVYKIQNCTMTADYHAPVDEYALGILQVLDSENGGSENRIIQIYWPHRTSQGAHLWYRMHNSSNMSDGWSNWTAITKKPATAGVADSASSVAWVNVTGKPSTFTPSSHTHGVIKSLSVNGTTITCTKDDGTTSTITTQDTNTTYGTFKGATTSEAGSTGLVIAPMAGNANRYLRSDGTWAVPPDTNTTYGVFAKATADAAGSTGLVPAPAKGQQTYYLRGDGTWAVPANTWRGIQDNLTSSSTTDSLSANQGKVLKGLIDGKAASGHTHNYAGSSSAGGAATSANKVNNALTINLNGTSQGAWDGSSAKSISITAASVGATSVTISRW